MADLPANAARGSIAKGTRPESGCLGVRVRK
jgi:hypothetical protein